MYPILDSAFVRFPMRRKVAELMLRQGMRVDGKGRMLSGEVEISPVKASRAVKVDRRVVIETIEMILAVPELFRIFSNLQPTSSIRGVAKTLGFEVIEIEAEPHTAGTVSAVSAVIASAGISIRQIVSDDPDIYPNPKLVIVLEKPLPGEMIGKLKSIHGIRRISIG